MKKTLLLLALFGSLMTVPATASACSVIAGWPPSAPELLEQKDAAFVGTVERIIQDKSANGEYRITFTVDESYKGSVDGEVTVRAQSSSAACGYDDATDLFEKGDVWMIYATGNSTDGYATDGISLNKEYKSVDAAVKAQEAAGLVSDDEPKVCTMQYAPVCGKTADGTVKTFGNACTLAAEKAETLYDGECKVTVGGATTTPTQDLWKGMRHADVTWLQEFLIGKLTGAAAAALKAVGATGYFGTLTAAALAEYQGAHGIAPASGYFGAKTRAAISGAASPAVATFTGEITAVSTACFADGICTVTVDGKDVIVLAGMRAEPIPVVGTLKGVDSVGELETKIGSQATVYAAPTGEGDAEYTLYGSAEYYVKVLPE